MTSNPELWITTLATPASLFPQSWIAATEYTGHISSTDITYETGTSWRETTTGSMILVYSQNTGQFGCLLHFTFVLQSLRNCYTCVSCFYFVTSHLFVRFRFLIFTCLLGPWLVTWRLSVRFPVYYIPLGGEWDNYVAYFYLFVSAETIA